jgi:hypothetical protein
MHAIRQEELTLFCGYIWVAVAIDRNVVNKDEMRSMSSLVWTMIPKSTWMNQSSGGCGGHGLKHKMCVIQQQELTLFCGFRVVPCQKSKPRGEN